MARLLTSDKKLISHPAPKIGMPHLSQRVFNTPLLIHPRKLEAILAAIGPRLGLAENMIPKVDEPLVHKRDSGDGAPIGPVVTIPVYGTLVKRGGYVGESGLMSYDAIAEMVDAAMKDTNVKALLFDIDSPGGEAAGLFDFCQYLTSVKGAKPMIGVSNDMAYSAAYAVASCMDRLFVTAIGGVGSIGVYMLHVDQSDYDKQKGVKYTYIYSGDKKVDGNPHEPMSKDAKATAQAEVDRVRDMFVGLVAGNRNRRAETIYNTEAATFMGEKGVPLLADAVGTYGDAMAYAQSAASAKRSIAVPELDHQFVGGWLGDISYMAANKKIALAKMYETAKSRPVFASDMGAHVGDNVIVMRAFGTLKLEQSKGDAPPTSRISGLLAPYNSMSCNLGGFYEIYQGGCFKNFLASDEDALVLAFHNPEHVLGRRSTGTARFWDDADGLHYEADLPDTQVARDLKTLIERGDVRGSSAAFYITRHRWEQRSGGRVRIIEEATLVEGSPHSFVAYAGTTAQTVGQDDPLAAIHETEHAKAKLRRLRLT